MTSCGLLLMPAWRRLLDSDESELAADSLACTAAGSSVARK
jgi:hypothetical protein